MRKAVFFLGLAIAFASPPAAASDYPTISIVEDVIICMHGIGEQNEENLYACACRFDVVANEMTFEEYEQGTISERFGQMPGKKGGLFRDAKDQKRLAKKLQKLRERAEKECPVVRRVSREPKAAE